MKLFKLMVLTNFILLSSSLTFASLPFSSNTSPEEINFLDYGHCLESSISVKNAPSDHTAYSIGDCFIRIAEELMMYFENNATASSPYRHRVITALQYADSWFRLAEISNETGAENRRIEIHAYIRYLTISN